MSIVHATAICKDNKAVLLMGAPGSGKSLLALTLIEQGWMLVSDDSVVLTAQNGRVLAANPGKMVGCIEARGLGILSKLPTQQDVPVVAVIVLETHPGERLVFEQKFVVVEGVRIPLFHLWREERYLPTLVLNAIKVATSQLKLLQNEIKDA